jgi:hypothetical protein
LKELEETGNAIALRNTQESIKAIALDLKKLSKVIKRDPNVCIESIDALVNSFQEKRELLSEGIGSIDNTIETQTLDESYGKAINACKEAKRVIEDARETNTRTSKIRAQIIQPKGSCVKILIPEGYKKAKYNNPITGMKNAIKGSEIALMKQTNRSINIVVISKIPYNKGMGFERASAIVDEIHNSLADNQGIITVESGQTRRGYNYIYSIVKTVDQEAFLGATYSMIMNVGNKEDLIEVLASFQEFGFTGERDSLCLSLAQNAEMVSMGDNGIVGWSEDPYDSGFTKGITMNLSERPGVDALFPNQPLSQARELISAIIEDKYLLTKEEAKGDGLKSQDSIMEEYENDMIKLYRDLFAKEPVLLRPSVTIEVE